MDEFALMQLCVELLEPLDPEIRHRIVRAIRDREEAASRDAPFPSVPNLNRGPGASRAGHGTLQSSVRPMLEHAQAFLAAVAAAPHLWQAIDVRVVAIEVEGRWHNLASRFLLTSVPVDRITRPGDLPRMGDFAVLQQVYDRDELPALVAQVVGGELAIQGQPVEFRGSDVGHGREPFVEPYDRAVHRLGSSLPESLRGAYQHGHALTFTGANAEELYRAFPRGLEGLDAALRGLDDPWGGVSDVLLHCLGESTAIRDSEARRVSFVAPLEARLSRDDLVLVEGSLSYGVTAASKAAGASCVLVVTGIDDQGARVARRISLAGRRWVRDPLGYRMAGQVQIRGAKRLRIVLRIGSFEIGKAEVEDRPVMTPLLLSAYQALFAAPRNFTDGLLNPDPKQSRAFEKNVALLFGYCGLVVEYFGDGAEQEGPDLLAQVPGTSIVLVVEITVGPLNQKGKMARLTERAERVRMMVAKTGGQVLPVMITANIRPAVAENELSDAEANGIRVLAMDDLARLLRMATHRAPVRHVAKFLAPHLVTGGLPALWGLRAWHPDTDAFDPER